MANTKPRTSFAAGLSLVALGVGVALALAEIGLRVLDVPPSPLAPLHVPSYRRSENPILRYTYRANLAADHAGYDAMHRGLSTNARGFRDREFTLPKPPEVTRILAIGDSTTVGLGIPELANTYPKLLERRLRRSGRKVEVLNLGVGGYDPEQAVELLRIEARDLEPDLVLLLVCLNDLSRGVDGGVEAALARAHAHLDPPAHGAAALWRRLRLVFFLQHRLRTPDPAPATVERDAGPTPLELGLEALARWSKVNDVPALAFLLPGLDGTFSRYAHGDVHERMARIAESNVGVAWIDLLPAFRAAQDASRILSFDGLHPNRVGTRLLVELLARELGRRGLP
jgi:lysophospholipase L1-like esterase